MFSLDPILLSLVALSGVAVLVMIGLHFLRQPTPIAYIITGVLLGPHIFGFITDHEILERLGEIGLILLLFFVGREMSSFGLIKNWRLVLFGTVFQVLFSVLSMLALGQFLEWPIPILVLLGFILSLSSTAVILKYLEGREMFHTKLGREITGILVVQDILVVPMLLVVSIMGEAGGDARWPFQVLGIAILLGILVLVRAPKKTALSRWFDSFSRDHELHIFLGLLVCFGFALLSGFFGLSTGLGAFVGGVVVARLGGATWVKDHLHTFHTFFLALFFVSVGMLIDVEYFAEHWKLVGGLVLLVFLANTTINALIFRAFGESWKTALAGGSMLAQIGELSFLLASAGLASNIFEYEAYQLAVLVIAVSLFLSPLWIESVRYAQSVRTHSKEVRKEE